MAKKSGREGFWIGKLLSLFGVQAKHNGMKTEEGFAFVQYIKCTEAMDKIDEVLGYCCMSWSTLNKVDVFKMKEGKHEVSRVREWFGI